MRRLIVPLSLAASLAAAAGAPAALAAQSIDPGMSRAQVLERLGRPTGERAAGAFAYLFYRNGCERECGTPDLVVLQDDRVVDAIFRSSTRSYTGTSSSPNTAAARRTAGADGEAPAAREGGRRMPAGSRGGLVEGRSTARPPAGDPPQTPGLRVAPRRAPAAAGAGAANVGATDLPERMNPRDSLSPRLDERATHEPHAADNQQERGTPPPNPRGLVNDPLSPPAPGIPAPAVTGVRPNPTDSARVARQRALQRAGQPVRADTSRRDTTTVRPPDR